MAGSMEERPNGPMDVQTHPRSAGMDGATARGGRLLPYPIFNRSRILPWPAKGVEKGGNGAVLALPRREGFSRAHILRMCALLGRAPALPNLEARDSGPGNATLSQKLGQSSRVREGHSGGEEGRELSIVESSPVPRQGGRQRPVA